MKEKKMSTETTSPVTDQVTDGILLTETAATKVKTLLDSEGREVQENQSGLGNEVFNLLTT
jgi:hypothetical protein